jgi:lysophospholipase L1-like esterase
MAMDLPTTKNIVILSDSQGREMDDAIKSVNTAVHTLAIIHPRGTAAISSKYQSCIHIVRSFRPDFIFLHCGHNDLVYHPHFNTNPINSQETRNHTLTLAQLLQANHPNTTILISALLPRSFKRNSSLTQDEVGAFNRLAKRHGQRLRAEASRLPVPIKVCLNMPIWNRISKAEETSDFFLQDGLHLTEIAKRAIATAWLKDIALNPPAIAI